ncbi:MAG: hypothetical protein ACK5WV_15195 [Chryseotalea sp.]|jgi:hypothetical protein|nr:hypothetical protein [Flammeovirgaceae bacterium]
MKIKKNIITSLFLILFLLDGCRSELEELRYNPDLNTLNFKSSQEMIDYFNNISSGINFKKKSTNENDFISFEQEYFNAISELENSRNIYEHDSILYANKDILELSDSTYIPKIVNPFYQLICNRKGYYESENQLHKVLNDSEIAIVNMENASLLINGNLNSSLVKIVKYNSDEQQVNGKVKGNCGQKLEVNYFANAKRCRDDRRVYVRAYAYFAISGNQYTPMVISEAYGEIRNWLCNWNLYSTELRTRNCSFTVTARLNNKDYSSSLSFPNKIANSKSIILHNGAVAQPITWLGGQIPTIQFTSIHLESTSRGVGLNNWAILDCK